MTQPDDPHMREIWGGFVDRVESWDLDHFSPVEFCRLTRPEWDGPRIHPPPPQIACSLRTTARLADAIREQWGGRVRVISGYRPPAYNRLVDGSPRSQHVAFRALDLKPAASYDIAAWIDHVEQIVADCRQPHNAIGLGRYFDGRGRFVHVDTGYYDRHRDWERR